MKKDLLLIDIQTHFTLKETDEYVEKLNYFLKSNKDNINDIFLIVDQTHKEKDNEWGEVDYEDETLFFDNQDKIKKCCPKLLSLFKQYIYSDKLPADLAFTLIMLQHNHKVNIFPIEKEYNSIREIIDYQLPNLDIFMKLIFELDKNNIDSEIISYNELEYLSNQSLIIKNILIEADKRKIDIYEIIDLLNNNIRLNPKNEINKFNKILDSQNEIIAMGGGLMECYLEELCSLINCANIENKKITVNTKTDLCFGFDIYNKKDFNDFFIKFNKSIKKLSHISKLKNDTKINRI